MSIMAKFSIETTVLIQGVKGKINEHGQIIDKNTSENLTKFATALCALVNKNFKKCVLKF